MNPNLSSVLRRSLDEFWVTASVAASAALTGRPVAKLRGLAEAADARAGEVRANLDAAPLAACAGLPLRAAALAFGERLQTEADPEGAEGRGASSAPAPGLRRRNAASCRGIMRHVSGGGWPTVTNELAELLATVDAELGRLSPPP